MDISYSALVIGIIYILCATCLFSLLVTPSWSVRLILMASKQQNYILIYFQSPLDTKAHINGPRKQFMTSFRYILDWFALD